MNKKNELVKLSDLRGLGKKRAKWLQDVGIDTVLDLHSIPAKKIEKLLRNKNYEISIKELKDWQAQVQELIDTKIIRQTSTKPGTTLMEEGKSVAAFVVEFQKLQTAKGEQVQTRVYQLVQPIERSEEENGNSAEWDGSANIELCDWMNEKVGIQHPKSKKERPVLESENLKMMIEEKLPVRKATITVKNKPVKKKKVVADKDTVIQPTAVSIPQIQVYQPPDSSHAIGNGQPDQIFQGYLKSDQPFTLAVNVLFSLALDSAKISKVLPYQIQGCVTNRKSGDVIQLNQVEDKISSSSELKKTTWLPVVALNSGFYRLEMWVTLRTKPEAMAFFEIPLLQVA